jgi:hypothetical protein
MGTWQKSDAPALQAGSSGSVTRRPPPVYARCNVAGEDCRAEVRSTQAGMNAQTSGLRLGKPFILRETRPMHREKPHKLLQVGVTPTPATSLRSKRSKSKAAAP